MLARYLVLQIARLLEESELSQRKIAQRLGVSRGVVAAIAEGTRGLHGHDDEVDFEDLAAEYGRCGGCGNWVPFPCVFCEAEAFRRRVAAGLSPTPSFPPESGSHRTLPKAAPTPAEIGLACRRFREQRPREPVGCGPRRAA